MLTLNTNVCQNSSVFSSGSLRSHNWITGVLIFLNVLLELDRPLAGERGLYIMERRVVDFIHQMLLDHNTWSKSFEEHTKKKINEDSRWKSHNETNKIELLSAYILLNYRIVFSTGNEFYTRMLSIVSCMLVSAKLSVIARSWRCLYRPIYVIVINPTDRQFLLILIFG